MLYSTIITILASAITASAKAQTSECTITASQQTPGCCEAPAVTSISYVDCQGCALQTMPVPTCDIVCSTIATIPGSAVTETKCLTTSTPIGYDPVTYPIVTSTPIEYDPVTYPIETLSTSFKA